MTEQQHPGWYVASGSRIFRDLASGRMTEVRTNEHGLDEVVAEGFHLEVLDGDRWWMDVNGVHVNLNTKHGAHIVAQYEPGAGGDYEEIPPEQVEEWARQSKAEMEERWRRFDEQRNGGQA